MVSWEFAEVYSGVCKESGLHFEADKVVLPVI